MAVQPDQSQRPDPRPPVLDDGRPRAVEPLPILDYACRDPGSEITFFGKSPSQLFALSLVFEWLLLCLGSLVLRGALLLLLCSGVWVLAWILLLTELGQRGYHSGWRGHVILFPGAVGVLGGVLMIVFS